MYPLKRLFTVVALVASICNVQPTSAQYSYQAEVHGSTPKMSPKPMMAALVETLAVTSVSHDHETGSLVFNSPTTVSLLQLRTLIESSGFVVVRFSATGASVNDVRSSEPADNLFPVMIDTGNEIEDNARYETAKALWIQAHPLEYEALMNGERPSIKDSDK